MKHSKRLEIFEEVRAEYAGFLASVLWKLTGDKELFAEALQINPEYTKAAELLEAALEKQKNLQ